ncbi:tetratricopeptide repeat protein [Polyangium sorediatum]|uniref:PEGA domain-containing protein n=1 Tax=Polyangium sorediatum TaxID=889274 RepID=A0ABT6P451_9BACT|nr:hypothetical protein [Polyangium sorediatum]MDI1435386.1 hypothetical protein [Polyangium sorediatum]
MTLARFVFVLVLVLVGGVSRADEPPGPPSRIDQAARFAELVREGDRARAAGRTSAAVQAYSEALRIRDDPAIVGRLGLVALEGGATAEAVSYLLRAIIDGHDVPPAERRRIQDAYERARPQVCRVDVALSHLGADVLIDGELERASSTAGEFYVFTSPGRHEVRATLGGFHDAIETIDAPKGGRVRVSLVLTPLPPPSPPPAPEAPATSKPASPAPSSPCPAPNSKPPAPSAPNSKPRRWSPAFGATSIYGALAPLPTFGFVASSEWPFGEVFSARLDIRVAKSARDVEGAAIRGVILGAWPALCATAGRFSGCLLGTAGAIEQSWDDVSLWRPFLGFGAGGTGRLISIGPAELRLSVDAAILLDNYPILLAGGVKLWTGPPLLGSLSALVVFPGH